MIDLQAGFCPNRGEICPSRRACVQVGEMIDRGQSVLGEAVERVMAVNCTFELVGEQCIVESALLEPAHRVLAKTIEAVGGPGVIPAGPN